MRTSALLVLLPVTLAGCGWAVPYNSTSSCPQLGEGVCASARSIYDASDHRTVVTAEDLGPPTAAATARAPVQGGAARLAAGSPAASGTAGAGVVANASVNAGAVPPAAAVDANETTLLGRGGALPVSFAPDGSVPLRVPSHIMRIWVAPYESGEGDLVMPGYVFTDVSPGGWQVGQTRVLSERTLKPLDPEPPAAGSGGSAPPASLPLRPLPEMRNPNAAPTVQSASAPALFGTRPGAATSGAATNGAATNGATAGGAAPASFWGNGAP